jgi:hypothetical protein
VFIKLAIACYIVMNFLKMIWYDDDKTNLTVAKIDLDEAGSLKYDGTNQLLFWSLKDSS